MLFLFQTLLAGPLFDLSHQPVLGPLSNVTNTRWGFWATASTADLQSLPGGCTFVAPAPRGHRRLPPPSRRGCSATGAGRTR
ncbi:MAG TPA: hypothetical protein VET24_14960 [Actinomycetota bacterium]|nr:hypothetical protein [Actinomycetota bacterium]